MIKTIPEATIIRANEWAEGMRAAIKERKRRLRREAKGKSRQYQSVPVATLKKNDEIKVYGLEFLVLGIWLESNFFVAEMERHKEKHIKLFFQGESVLKKV